MFCLFFALWFRFLFENQTPAHVYYRWKLYSILQASRILVTIHNFKHNEIKEHQNKNIFGVFFCREMLQPSGGQKISVCSKMDHFGGHHH